MIYSLAKCQSRSITQLTIKLQKIRHDTEHQKVPEQQISLKPFKAIVLKLQVIFSLAKCQSSYYSVSYGATAPKMCHDTDHQTVLDQ